MKCVFLLNASVNFLYLVQCSVKTIYYTVSGHYSCHPTNNEFTTVMLM